MYLYICIVHMFSQKKKKKKKKNPSLGLGKKLKRYAALPHYLSFLLGMGGKLNPSKNFKTSQSALSDHRSLPCTYLDPSVSVTHSKIVHFCKITCIFSTNFAPFQ